MTKENAHLYLPLVQALAEGRTIQCCDGQSLWRDRCDCGFTSPPETYRVKPDPAMVPLEASDVPPGTVIRRCEWSNAWQLITAVYQRGVAFNRQVADYEDLVGICEIKRPGEDWQACCKPELEGFIPSP